VFQTYPPQGTFDTPLLMALASSGFPGDTSFHVISRHTILQQLSA